MDLKGEIASAHGIQEIETDGKLRPESSMHGVSQQLTRMREDQVDRRYLDSGTAESQQQTVFFGDAVETPRMVRLVFGQVAHFLYPMSTPGTGIEVGHQPKGTSSNLFQAGAQRVPGNHF